MGLFFFLCVCLCKKKTAFLNSFARVLLSLRARRINFCVVVFFEEKAREKEGESEREKEKRLSDDDDEEDAAEKEKTIVIINIIKVESGL